MTPTLIRALRPVRSCSSLSGQYRNFTKSVRPAYAAAASTGAKKPAAKSAASRHTAPQPAKASVRIAPGSKPGDVHPDLIGIDPQAAIGAPPGDAEPTTPGGPTPSYDPIPEPTWPPKPPTSSVGTANGNGNGNGNNTGVSEQGANGNGSADAVNWGNSFHGLSTVPFPAETARVLMQDLSPDDVEVKPDGIIYLPEIKYRRILNKAFGPGGWGLAPRGDLLVGEKMVSRPYALVVHGRFIAEARGECQFMFQNSIATAGEGAKSNALMRCCKDLGIAAELWDPRFIRKFKKEHCHEVWVEHVVSKQKRKIWLRKDCEPSSPFKLAPSKF